MANSETTPLAGASLAVRNAEQHVRMGFVRKVYGILSAQLLLTTLIATPFQRLTPAQVQANSWVLVLSSIVLMATMCSMLCCGQQMRTFPTNYLFLSIITVCMGVLVGFSSAMYTWQSVVLCAAVTVVIFLGLTVYAWTSTTDFTGYGPYLFAFMLVLMVFGFTLSILSLCGVYIRWMVMFYDLLGVLLFVFYIVFDTQMIIGGKHKVQFTLDDYAFASLNLYLDIINLFLHLLRLLGDRK